MSQLLLDRSTVRVIGAGLAGCEAAYQLANAGFRVQLFEMKPHMRTPAQVSDNFAELVCSNSFRSNNPTNAVGLIKEEMRRIGGFIIECAEATRVPAGDALAVDRVLFAEMVEGKIKKHPNINVVVGQVEKLPQDNIATIVATGPLTSDALAQDLVRVISSERLAFYDAIAPIIEADSIDMEHAFSQSRWDKGDGQDYVNCPMSKDEYQAFYAALRDADTAHAKAFEKLDYFEGCLPIEVLAERGEKTLLFGPLKPVGLTDPRTSRRPYAVLQLRKEDIHGTSYNLVGCQTRLTWPAQREVFSHVPALRNVKFLRYGAIHRNTYLDAPNVLDEAMRLLPNTGYDNIFFAGQITGVEGYVESTACGFIVSLLVQDVLRERKLNPPPATTALGGLYRHTRGVLRANPKDAYVPSNVTWAMLPTVDANVKDKSKKREMLVERAMMDLMRWKKERASI